MGASAPPAKTPSLRNLSFASASRALKLNSSTLPRPLSRPSSYTNSGSALSFS